MRKEHCKYYKCKKYNTQKFPEIKKFLRFVKSFVDSNFLNKKTKRLNLNVVSISAGGNLFVQMTHLFVCLNKGTNKYFSTCKCLNRTIFFVSCFSM